MTLTTTEEGTGDKELPKWATISDMNNVEAVLSSGSTTRKDKFDAQGRKTLSNERAAVPN